MKKNTCDACDGENLQIKLERKKIDIVTTIIMIGFFVAVAFCYYQGAYLHKAYPENTFLFDPSDKFNDLMNDLKRISDFNPYQLKTGLEPAVYFPFMYTFLYVLQKIFSDGLFYFLIISLLLFLLLINSSIAKHAGYNKINALKAVFILSVMTYPVLIEIDRANIEVFLFISLTLSVLFFYKKNYYTSSFFLAMAIAMKAYPAIFLLLFIKERKFKPLMVCVFNVVLLSGLSLFFLGNDFLSNMEGLIFGLNFYHSAYVINDGGLWYGSNLFGATKLILRYFSVSFNPETLGEIFSFSSIPIYIFVCIYILKKRVPFWKQLALITCSYLLLMPCTPSYKLLALYMPLWFFFLDRHTCEKDSTLYSILFALLLIPKPFAHGLPEIINPLLMLILFIFLLININRQAYNKKKLSLTTESYTESYLAKQLPK